MLTSLSNECQMSKPNTTQIKVCLFFSVSALHCGAFWVVAVSLAVWLLQFSTD